MTVIEGLARTASVVLLAAALVGAAGCGSPVSPTGAERLRPAPSESSSGTPSEGETDGGAGGSGGNGHGPSGGAGGAGGGEGTGGGGGEAQQRPDVVVSPLRIPLPTDEVGGRDLVSGLSDVRKGIAEACGGSQCVRIEIIVVESDLDRTRPCGIILYVRGSALNKGGSGSHVDTVRGGKVTVVVNGFCDDVPSEPEVPPTDPEVPSDEPLPPDEPSPEQPAPDPPPPEQDPPQEQTPSPDDPA